MDQMEEILAPMATRLVTNPETDFAGYMMKRAGWSTAQLAPRLTHGRCLPAPAPT